MVAVADLERFLERVFERTSARLFRSRIQAVQVERRVERAMEAGRSGRGASTTVPNRYRVRLHPADLEDLARRTGGFEALAVRLADRALAFARLHSYHLAARPVVSVVADPSVEPGRVEVDASDGTAQPMSVPAPHPPGSELPLDGAPNAELLVEAAAIAEWPLDAAPNGEMPVGAAPIAASPALGEPSPRQPPGPPAWGLDNESSPVVAPLGLRPSSEPRAMPDADLAPAPSVQPPVSAPSVQTPVSVPAAAPDHGLRAADRPYAVRPAPPPASRGLLRVMEPGGREREVRVEGQPLTLGRAPDNALVIADTRVSRHHGRVQARHGTLVYTDLGSTNGTRVNGIRVDEIVLGPGDRLQIGDVVLVVEQLPR